MNKSKLDMRGDVCYRKEVDLYCFLLEFFIFVNGKRACLCNC